MQLARIVKIALAGVALALGVGGVALAQRNEAGVFDYYVLALSWSPTHCIEVGDERRDPQLGELAEPGLHPRGAVHAHLEAGKRHHHGVAARVAP